LQPDPKNCVLSKFNVPVQWQSGDWNSTLNFPKFQKEIMEPCVGETDKGGIGEIGLLSGLGDSSYPMTVLDVNAELVVNAEQRERIQHYYDQGMI
jgi:hypothetical protein